MVSASDHTPPMQPKGGHIISGVVAAETGSWRRKRQHEDRRCRREAPNNHNLKHIQCLLWQKEARARHSLRSIVAQRPVFRPPNRPSSSTNPAGATCRHNTVLPDLVCSTPKGSTHVGIMQRNCISNQPISRTVLLS